MNLGSKPEPKYDYTGYDLKYINYKFNDLKYLITGTGRCGTVYMAKLLSSVGYPCTHEAVFKHDGIEAAHLRLNGSLHTDLSEISKLASVVDESNNISWFGHRRQSVAETTVNIVAEASYMAAPFIKDESLKNATIIHVVRKPIDVINSFVAGFKYFENWCLTEPDYAEYHNFIYSYVPSLKEPMTALCRAARYYIEWNKMIERLSEGKNYILHRVENSPEKLLKRLNVSTKDYYKNTQANHKEGLKQQFTYNDISIPAIRQELLDMESKYYKSLKVL
jgi:hypothetical protein